MELRRSHPLSFVKSLLRDRDRKARSPPTKFRERCGIWRFSWFSEVRFATIGGYPICKVDIA